MITSTSVLSLCKYTTAQLNIFFPDNDVVDLSIEKQWVERALEKIEYCFKHVTLKHYFNGDQVIFNHLFSDHYVMYLWFLSNVVYLENGKCSLADKLYYLNKLLNGLDCMYDTKLPDIFLIFHSSGTMLGKAFYSDFFIVFNGCTVGSQNGNYPSFSKGVSITANSSVVGDCLIGCRSTISTRTLVFEKNIPDDHVVFMDLNIGKLKTMPANKCFAQQFFNVDLYKIQ